MEEELRSNLRRRFFEEYRGLIEAGKFAVEDVRRVRTDDLWLDAFLRRCDDDLDVTLPVLIECMKWRHDFEVNHLSILRLKPYLERGGLFIRGVDKQNQPILWFNVRHHRKDFPTKDSQAVIAYWLEKHQREAPKQQLVIVFDMTSTGLQNMDLDVIKFLLHSLKFYYPGTLAYLLVVEIPWILQAAWKLVRSWLDPVAQKKIIFVSASTLGEYIPIQNRPMHLTGTDDFQFSLDQVLSESATFRDASSMDDSAVPNGAPGGNSVILDEEPVFFKRKTVKFADENEIFEERSASFEAPSPVEVVTTSSSLPGERRQQSPASRGSAVSRKLRELADYRARNMVEQAHVGPLLHVSPRDELILQSVSGEGDRVDVMLLRNPGRRTVAFKIKITSPERFRVRPSSGVIPSGSGTVVKVYLQPGYEQTVHKDKFLIQSVEMEENEKEPNAERLLQIWKTSSSNIMEHRLRCRVEDSNLMEDATQLVAHPPIDRNTVVELQQTLEVMRGELRILKLFLVLACSLLVVIFIHQRLIFGNSSNSCYKQ